MAAKQSPNAPCPCGSGKKYKKCCQATALPPYEGSAPRARSARGTPSAEPNQSTGEPLVSLPIDEEGYRLVPEDLAWLNYGFPLFELMGDEALESMTEDTVSERIGTWAKELWDMAVAELEGKPRPEFSDQLNELLAHTENREAFLEMMNVRARLMYPDFPTMEPDSDVREAMVDIPDDWQPPDEQQLLGVDWKPVADATRLGRMHTQLFSLAEQTGEDVHDRIARLVTNLIDGYADWLRERGVPSESVYMMRSIAAHFYMHQMYVNVPIENYEEKHLHYFLLLNLFRTPWMRADEHAHAGAALITLGQFVDEILGMRELGDSIHLDLAYIRIDLTAAIIRYYGLLPTEERVQFYERMQAVLSEDMPTIKDDDDIASLHSKLVDVGTFVGMAQYIQDFERWIGDLRTEYAPYEKAAFPYLVKTVDEDASDEDEPR